MSPLGDPHHLQSLNGSQTSHRLCQVTESKMGGPLGSKSNSLHHLQPGSKVLRWGWGLCRPTLTPLLSQFLWASPPLNFTGTQPSSSALLLWGEGEEGWRRGGEGEKGLGRKLLPDPPPFPPQSPISAWAALPCPAFSHLPTPVDRSHQQPAQGIMGLKEHAEHKPVLRGTPTLVITTITINHQPFPPPSPPPPPPSSSPSPMPGQGEGCDFAELSGEEGECGEKGGAPRRMVHGMCNAGRTEMCGLGREQAIHLSAPLPLAGWGFLSLGVLLSRAHTLVVMFPASMQADICKTSHCTSELRAPGCTHHQKLHTARASASRMMFQGQQRPS